MTSCKLKGRKKGMTQIFDDLGHSIVCTVIEVEPNVVTQLKTKEKDGYNAVQMGFEKVTAKDPRRQEARSAKPQRGHFARANVEPRKHQFEFRVTDESKEEFEVGQEIGVGVFEKDSFLDICATSIGKGYQGVMKKYGFRGGPAAHGSGFHRHAGSTGMRSTPGRCLPGGPRPSQMGNVRVTKQNSKVIMVNEETGVILVKGPVPGPVGSLVTLSQAVKKTK